MLFVRPFFSLFHARIGRLFGCCFVILYHFVEEEESDQGLADWKQK